MINTYRLVEERKAHGEYKVQVRYFYFFWITVKKFHVYNYAVNYIKDNGVFAYELYRY